MNLTFTLKRQKYAVWVLATTLFLILTACQPTPITSDNVLPPTVVPPPIVVMDPDVSLEQLSPEGKIAFVSDRDGQHKVYVMDADGRNQFRLTDLVVSEEHGPQWSPDGTQIAFVSTVEDNTDIYLVNADGSNLMRLTNDLAKDGAPDWSPDGTQLVFETFRTGDWEIYLINIDGSNLIRLTNNPAGDTNPTWTSDGKRVSFVSGRNGNASIYTVDMNGSDPKCMTRSEQASSDPSWSASSPPKMAFRYWVTSGLGDICVLTNNWEDGRCLTSNVETGIPSWSPDGTMLAYRVKRHGRWIVEIANVDGSGVRGIETVAPPKGDPVWSPDGRWLAFQIDYENNMEVFTIRVDGLQETRLTTEASYDGEPHWVSH